MADLPEKPVMRRLELPDASAPPLGRFGWRGRARLGRIAWAAVKLRSAFWLRAKGVLPASRDERARRRAEGAMLRRELVALGPTFVKIGQTLATRVDLLPFEYVDELRELQDRVPPFPDREAFAILEEELGRPRSEVFASVDAFPIASASIGQVYRAKLRGGGEEVVVKIQRPGLAARIELDLAVLRHLAPRLARSAHLKAVDWPGVVEEFAAHLREEIDFEREVANAETFRANFASLPDVYVPAIRRELCGPRVITMEYIPGVKVDDHDGLRRMGLAPMAVAESLVRAYLKQLLEDGFFHADPHPGNLRLMPDGRMAFFDFGMVGRISLELQSQLVDAFFHIVERDWRALLRDGVKLGFIRIDPDDAPAFEGILGELLAHYEGMRGGGLTIDELFTKVADILYQYPFQIPAHFTFILRAILTLEGIGKKADPSFNFFVVARPHAKEFMLRREGRYLGGKLLKQVLRTDEGKVDWGKAWKLAKMAWKHYVKDKG